MKRILILLLLFFSLVANAQIDSTEMQTDSVQVKLVQLPDSTAVGAPDGKPVSKEIGAAGGTIISDDGRVELIFPAGALTAKETISIQPIVDLIPNGNGKGYQFEPSGIRFVKPVELIFHYTKEEEDICPALLKFVAIQSSNGSWEYMDYEGWDSTTRSLKGHIFHFSAMVDGNLVELVPGETTMRVGGKESFYLSRVLPPEERSQPSSGENDDDLANLPGYDVRSANKLAIWSVTSGTINKVPGANVQAMYTAPKHLPRDGVVKVKLNLNTVAVINEGSHWRGSKLLGFKKTIVTDRATFTAEVHLYDEYAVSIKDNSELRAGMGIFEEDMGSFDVKIVSKGCEFVGKIYSDDKIDVDDIQNFHPAFTKKYNPPKPFTLTVDTKTPSEGRVDIGRLIGVGQSSSDLNDTLDISIQFEEHDVLVCKVIEGGTRKGMPSVPVVVKDKSIPTDIKFKANGEAQIIDHRNRQGYGYTISITPAIDKK